MVSASLRSSRGWVRAQVIFFWEQIHKEVAGGEEAKYSKGRGCCSSRLSPLVEEQKHQVEVSLPQQLQAQAPSVYFYQVDAVIPEALSLGQHGLQCLLLPWLLCQKIKKAPAACPC